MLKLQDFLHLPQLDEMINKLIYGGPGLIIIAGIEPHIFRHEGSAQIQLNRQDLVKPSGLSALLTIMIQEILLARPLSNAIVVSEQASIARLPNQMKRRIAFLSVNEDRPYTSQIDIATRQRPDLLVIDHLDNETVSGAFDAAKSGLRVITQLDTVLQGSAIISQLLEMGINRTQTKDLRWILTSQRMPTLCPSCKQIAEVSDDFFNKLTGRYPQLIPTVAALKLRQVHESRQMVNRKPVIFYQAKGCDRCHGNGYQGDISVFDLYFNDPKAEDPFNQASLLSLEEYALHLAAEGLLDLNDLINLETNHLRRTYHLLNTSEQALKKTNSELTRKLLELEASNRVLLQRTEVLMSLEDLGNAMISSSSLNDLAARVCRRAGELCGADKVILYLRRLVNDDQEIAEILASRGWEGITTGQQIPSTFVFGQEGNYKKVTRFLRYPPGVKILEENSKDRDETINISMGLRVPLVAQEQLVGVMIVQCTQKNFFSQGESALLQTFANQAALAIQRAGLVEDLRAKINQLEAAQSELIKKERIERELELARQVQQAMLPRNFPFIPGVTISGHYEPARQVGGDFYDLIQLDEQHFGIVMADVADKGMPAALYMALARSLLLAEARREKSPRSALYNVNRLLLEIGDLSGFVSVFYGVVDQKAHKLSYSRAGHERPFLIRGDQLHVLGGNGAVLGILDAEHLHLDEEEIQLEPEDRLILYTDGLTDVENEQGEFFGAERLIALMKSLRDTPASQVCHEIYNSLMNYRGKAEQFDDMTLLVVQIQN